MTQEIEALGAKALPIPSAEPYEFWDAEAHHGRGILSLKHAAQLAGLGTLGKNTVLLHPRFGNRLWLGAVLTDLELEPDPLLEKQCMDSCRLCLNACPKAALDGTTINQKLCRENSFRASEGGGWFYSCCRCLQACPAAKAC
jgi:epoxyqueuosine reductase QueG